MSTQVVEAGVDLDFPVVFRAIGPLDAIIQAAGRCDREGKRTLAAGRPGGRVVVFKPAATPAMPPGFYEEATTRALVFLEENSANPQRILYDPSLFADYHPTLIAMGKGREKSQAVQDARKMLDFIKVAEAFPRHRRGGTGVVVRYGNAASLLEAIHQRQFVFDRRSDALQRYTVNLYPTWVAKAPVSAQTRHRPRRRTARIRRELRPRCRAPAGRTAGGAFRCLKKSIDWLINPCLSKSRFERQGVAICITSNPQFLSAPTHALDISR